MHDVNEFAPRQAFVSPAEAPAIVRHAEHGGSGQILFHRLLLDSAFNSAIDFVDFTVIEPGSTIGLHEHVESEELYFILSGTPIVTVNGDSRRLKRGDVTVVRSGQWHELVNDTTSIVEIFVIQVHL